MKGKPTRKCSIFLVAVMVVGAFLNAFAWFPQAAKAAGSGTADDPYIITTAAELNNIRSNLGGHYRLGGNINLCAYTNWEPIGTTVTPFSGSLDGGRFTVSNLKIVRPTEDYVGLFGSVKGSISRINLANVDVQGKDYTGGLLGAISSGQVEEATVTGTVQGTSNVGGLGGLFSNTAAVNASSANVNVYGQKNLGGFLGAYASNALVSDISAAGNVNVFGAGSSGGLIGVFTSTAILRNSHASGNVVIPVAMSTQRIGGLIGEFSSGKIQYCYATGNVGSISFSGQNYYAIGGLVGYSVGTIEKSYATGNTSVNGLETNVGGFVGQAAGGSITNNYAMGKVFAPSPLSAGIGGFIGSSRATLKNNYSAVAISFTGSSGSSFLGKKEGGTVSGNYFDVNIAGTANSIDAAHKATADMKKMATFVGWDFDMVWSINEGVSYPQLRPYVATYSVTYNGNGSTSGQAPADSGLYPASGTVTVLGNTGMLERSGFVFAGWNSKADGTGDDYAPASSFSMPSRKLTLYAKWIPLTYTIEAIQTQTLSPLTAGYNPGTQESKTVTITKTGTGSLTNLNVQLSGTAAGSFELIGPAVTELNDGKPSTTFTVKAKNQLPAGTYQATITVAAELMTAVTFTVEQVVTELVNAAEPTIMTQPVGSTVKVGDADPVLSVAANSTDDGQLSYQWFLNDTDGTSGAFMIEGATSSSYTISTEYELDRYYYVVIKNTKNAVNGNKTAEVTSAFVRVKVEEVVNAAQPTITTQPVPSTVKVGDTHPVLSVAAHSTDDGQLSYQWYRNDTASTSGAFAIEDATGSSYTVSTEYESDLYYYVVIKNTKNAVNGNKTAEVTSAFVKVTVTGVIHAEAPLISSQPVSVTVNAGDAPVLSVTAQSTDGGTLSYQWYSNTTNSTSGASAIPSVTGSTYAAPATVLGSVYYYVLVTNTNHTINGNPIAAVTSDIVAVTVNELINAAVPVLSAQPIDAVVNLGEAGPTLRVTAQATDGGILSYQWYSNTSYSTKGGAAIPDGTGSTYTAPTTKPGTTYYYVVVTSHNQAANGNQTATAISIPVAVTVNPPAPTHTVIFDSQGGSVVAGVTNVLHGSKLTAPVSPSKSGYSFSGWYKDAAGTVAWNFDTDLVTGDVTLYAKWTENSSSGDGDGGSDDNTDNGPGVASGNQSGGAPVPATDAVIVLVNGREEKIGKSASSTEGERTVTTITVNPQQLEDKLQAEGQGAVVTIPVSAQSDVIIGELNGQMVKNMEDKQAVLVVQTGHASYTIPSVQVDIGSISKQLGSAAALEEIKVQIRIAEPEAAMLKVGESAAGQNGLTLVAPPVYFTVEASYEGQTVEVTKFNAYVERTIALPEGIDPNKITTGIVTEADGSVRHVPTKVTVMGGKYYAQINSLTNSMYSVIWHPLTFKDVEQHWAQQDVNDMGSRLVVNGVGDGLFNPDAAITRAEFAAIVMRGLGLKPVGGSAVFTDVQASDWYYTAVQTTSGYKLIDGFEDGTFRPNEKITREQAMLIIARAMAVTKLQGKLPAKEISELLKPFADAAAASDWAKAGITASLQAGLVTGRSADELAPQASITRAEVATIVKRLLKESGLI